MQHTTIQIKAIEGKSSPYQIAKSHSQSETKHQLTGSSVDVTLCDRLETRIG